MKILITILFILINIHIIKLAAQKIDFPISRVDLILDNYDNYVGTPKAYEFEYLSKLLNGNNYFSRQYYLSKLTGRLEHYSEDCSFKTSNNLVIDSDNYIKEYQLINPFKETHINLIVFENDKTVVLISNFRNYFINQYQDIAKQGLKVSKNYNYNQLTRERILEELDAAFNCEIELDNDFPDFTKNANYTPIIWDCYILNDYLNVFYELQIEESNQKASVFAIGIFKEIDNIDEIYKTSAK